MFNKADIVLLNKADLAALSDVDLAELERNVRKVNPNAMVVSLSCKTGEGLDVWIKWLREALASRKMASVKA